MSDEVLDYSVALKRRWLYLAIGAFLLLMIGFIYGWSILAIPLQDEFAWTSAQLSVVWIVSMVLFCFGALLGSCLTRCFSPRVTILIASMFLAAGYLIASSVSHDGLDVLTVAYGVLVGGGTGMAYNATLSSVNRWFPDKVGVSSGLLTFGFGLGSLAIGMIVGLGIDVIGWRWSFRVVGMITALVAFGASFFVRVPSEGQKLPSPLTPKTLSSHMVIEKHDYTIRQMLGQKTFYLTFFWSVMVGASYLAIMGNAKQIALEAGAIAPFATFMVGIISLSDGVGRLTSGLFFDRFGYRPSLIAIPFLYLLASVLLFIATSATSAASATNAASAASATNEGALSIAFAGYLLVGLGFGSVSTVLAAITNRFYGQRNYAGNLAVAYMDFVPGSFIGPPLLGLIETAAGSYRYGFVPLMAFSLLGILAALFVRPPRFHSSLSGRCAQ